MHAAREMSSDFIGHVGDPGIHDGVIIELRRAGANLVVRIETIDGALLDVEFSGVSAVDSHEPVGMMLYALSEFEHPGPSRRFAFGNWHEPDASDAALSVIADAMRCTQRS